MKNRSGKKLVAFIVENHAAFAALNIDRFFAVEMLAGVPTDGNLGSHQTAAAGRETQLRGNHQRSLVILGRSHPL